MIDKQPMSIMNEVYDIASVRESESFWQISDELRNYLVMKSRYNARKLFNMIGEHKKTL